MNQTSLGRDTWKSLTGSEASLQDNCNKEGFNAAVKDQFSKARIGIIANTQKECESCDSRIGQHVWSCQERVSQIEFAKSRFLSKATICSFLVTERDILYKNNAVKSRTLTKEIW